MGPKIHFFKRNDFLFIKGRMFIKAVKVVERSKACIVFAGSEAGIVGSNFTHGMDVWCAIFCLCTGRGLATS
jgi:hypothetical protein